jgi:hypothetical protein
VEPQSKRAGVARAEALAQQADPESAGGAELGDLLEQV